MHAYLIIAHNEFEVLQKLLQALDDKRNDIYVHIDKKVKTLPTLTVTQSRLYLLDKRVDVRWGTVSQIKAEYRLMEEAYRRGGYDYYHIISGTHYPLKSQDELHAYFDGLCGKSLLQPMESNDYQIDLKLRRYNSFVGGFHHPISWISRTSQFVWKALIRIQKICHIRQNKNRQYIQASNWASLSEEAVHYLLENKKVIVHDYRYSFCGDEFFVPTELAIGNMGHELFFSSNMLYQQLGRAQTSYFTMADYEEIMTSNCLFARKFSGQDMDIIERIYQQIHYA